MLGCVVPTTLAVANARHVVALPPLLVEIPNLSLDGHRRLRTLPRNWPKSKPTGRSLPCRGVKRMISKCGSGVASNQARLARRRPGWTGTTTSPKTPCSRADSNACTDRQRTKYTIPCSTHPMVNVATSETYGDGEDWPAGDNTVRRLEQHTFGGQAVARPSRSTESADDASGDVDAPWSRATTLFRKGRDRSTGVETNFKRDVVTVRDTATGENALYRRHDAFTQPFKTPSVPSKRRSRTTATPTSGPLTCNSRRRRCSSIMWTRSTFRCRRSN